MNPKSEHHADARIEEQFSAGQAIHQQPRGEVIDELFEAVIAGQAPLHDGEWAKGTLEICIAILESSESGKDVSL